MASMATSEASTRRRVKLYMLNEERQWDDKGTGHVSAVLTDPNSMALVVISETDGSYLLESRIQPDTAYQKQQETLIVWSEGENMDLALSFQEKVGCDDIWEKICNVQGKDPSVDITQDLIDESDEAEDTEGEPTNSMQNAQSVVDLPPCELGHLEEITQLFSQAATSPMKRDRLATSLERSNFLKQLTDVFHKAEDLEDLESLHHLYDVIRHVIMFNKQNLYEIIFADDMLMDVIGILEYNPTGRSHHRDFLRNQAHFKEVLPLHNTDLVSKIHQTYRVQYIQDCCLPPPSLFDENSLSALTSFVFFNKIEIVTALQDDEKFMKHLFNQLRDEETDDCRRRDLALFVKEFCNISVTLQPVQKENFFTSLSQHGALKAVEVLLAMDDKSMKSAALDILQAFVEHQPSLVREFVTREVNQCRSDDELLINIMMEQLLNDTDPELSDAFLLGNMLKMLIDPENMMNNTGSRTEKTEFLTFFYRRCINTLTKVLFDNTTGDAPSQDDYRTALVLSHVLELLTFCIENHTYHMKNYCFNKDLVKRVLVLLKSQHKFLVLGAIRLLRRVVNMKEEFYNRYLIKNNLFKPIIDLFLENGHRYNLLDSAIIELFEYIRQEDVSTLVAHIVDNYWDLLHDKTYVQTFHGLKLRFDQSMDRTSMRPGGVGCGPGTPASAGAGPGGASTPTLDMISLVNAASNRLRRETRALDEDEEQWFDQDDDEEEDTGTSHLSVHSAGSAGSPDQAGGNDAQLLPVGSPTNGALSFIDRLRRPVSSPQQLQQDKMDTPLRQVPFVRQPGTISIQLKSTAVVPSGAASTGSPTSPRQMIDELDNDTGSPTRSSSSSSTSVGSSTNGVSLTTAVTTTSPVQVQRPSFAPAQQLVTSSADDSKLGQGHALTSVTTAVPDQSDNNTKVCGDVEHISGSDSPPGPVGALVDYSDEEDSDDDLDQESGGQEQQSYEGDQDSGEEERGPTASKRPRLS